MSIYYKSFIKDNFLVLTGHFLIYAQGIILMPIIIKTAGVTVYGGYALVVMSLGFLFGISSFGVGFKCKRFLPSAVDIKSRQKLFYPQMLFQLTSIAVLSLVLSLFSPLIKQMFIKKEIEFFIWLAVLYLFLYMLYSQTTDYFRYTGRMNYFNYATISLPYLNIVIVLLIYFFFHRLNVNLLVSANLLSVGLITIPLILKTINELGFGLPTIRVKELIKDVKLGFPLVLGYVLDFILSGSDRYVIVSLMSVTAVGYYSPAYALGSLVIFFPKVSGVVLPPLLSKAVDNGRKEEAQIMVNYTIKGFLLIAIPFIVGSFVLSKQLLTMFANAEVAKNAFLVTPVVAIGVLFYGLNIILSNVLFVQMKTKVMFKTSLLAACTNLILNIIFIYLFKNILVAAITTLFSYFLVFLYMYRTVTIDWTICFDLKAIFKSFVATMGMAVVLLLWIHFQLELNINQFINVLGEVIIGGTIYVVMLFVLRVFSSKELYYLKNIFLRRRI